ncbi:hypothetical protein [Hymenobacter actinosclerus]|uniref:Lipoprotein n=1 Tax=Hymenobacter actinosclerus TaxID=82805 RepID=A0A1I0B176_9BACT|nr:hypothetical protein [Hymenobacter actinosclerus]SET00220.1 hypothetical protein SAMN04487998_0901 [Hymenobacter actinosclerus]
MRPNLYFALALLTALTSACSGSQMAGGEKSGPSTGTTEAGRNATVDVPALVGRNIDQLRRTMGAPKETREQAIGLEPTAAQMKATKGQDWINTFERNGTTLVVTFDASTRKVRDIVLLGSDEDTLLREANLSLTSPEYLVLPVMSPGNSTELIGMRVVARR